MPPASYYSNGTSPVIPIGALAHHTNKHGTNGRQTGDMPNESTAMWSRIEDIFRNDQQKRQLIEVMLLESFSMRDITPD